MKLYVNDTTNPGNKIYLDIIAATRYELSKVIGNAWFTLGNNTYHVNQVRAEEDSSNNTATGTVVGGLIGLIGGPFGVAFGSLVGGVIGNESDKSESKKVSLFNESRMF